MSIITPTSTSTLFEHCVLSDKTGISRHLAGSRKDHVAVQFNVYYTSLDACWFFRTRFGWLFDTYIYMYTHAHTCTGYECFDEKFNSRELRKKNGDINIGIDIISRNYRAGQWEFTMKAH